MAMVAVGKRPRDGEVLCVAPATCSAANVPSPSDEHTLSLLANRWPGRESEVRRLWSLLSNAAHSLPIFVHGPTATGKSSIVREVVRSLKMASAIVDCLSGSAQTMYEGALNQLHHHQPCARSGYPTLPPPHPPPPPPLSAEFFLLHQRIQDPPQ